MSDINYQKQLDIIKTCLEQKIALLTLMLDLTKQIEVQSVNDDMDLDDLLIRRGNCIERHEKCNILIRQQVETIAVTDHNLAEKVKLSLLGEKTDDKALNEFGKSSKHITELFNRIKAINEKAQKNLLSQREKMKEEINRFRAANASSEKDIFHK